MSATARLPLVAVDIGNSRIKLGLFEAAPPPLGADGGLPQPSQTLDLLPDAAQWETIAGWLAPIPPAAARWWIGSVQRTLAARLVDWLRSREVTGIMLLASPDLPLRVSLPRPDMVGIDRLLAAVAANRLRRPGLPAIVVDLGTAITVDLISAEGAFLGGAILPGIGLSARALNEFTDLLPLLEMASLGEPPPALGTSTLEALRSGIYWGAVGGIRQLTELLSQPTGGACQLFLTGGAAPAVASLLSPSAVFEPHLVLAGIALTAK